MKYTFEQIKNNLTELVDFEPELRLWINGHEYIIILYADFCTFGRCGGDMAVVEFKSLDDLYNSLVLDNIVLKRDWENIEKVECFEFNFLDMNNCVTQLHQAHDHCTNNKEELINSEFCGCFHCLEIFSGGKIKEWTDEGTTALCPFCGIDAVIGDKSGYPITKEFLQEMRKAWF